ncbi:hypothetical protein Hanom_Chr09g00827581 [Helianthus anomalus]
MIYGGDHVVRTVSDSQPAVTGIDGPMSIIYMLRFCPIRVWLCVNYSNSIFYYQTCVLTFTLYVLTLF